MKPHVVIPERDKTYKQRTLEELLRYIQSDEYASMLRYHYGNVDVDAKRAQVLWAIQNAIEGGKVVPSAVLWIRSHSADTLKLNDVLATELGKEAAQWYEAYGSLLEAKAYQVLGNEATNPRLLRRWLVAMGSSFGRTSAQTNPYENFMATASVMEAFWKHFRDVIGTDGRIHTDNNTLKEKAFQSVRDALTPSVASVPEAIVQSIGDYITFHTVENDDPQTLVELHNIGRSVMSTKTRIYALSTIGQLKTRDHTGLSQSILEQVPMKTAVVRDLWQRSSMFGWQRIIGKEQKRIPFGNTTLRYAPLMDEKLLSGVLYGYGMLLQTDGNRYQVVPDESFWGKNGEYVQYWLNGETERIPETVRPLLENVLLTFGYGRHRAFAERYGVQKTVAATMGNLLGIAFGTETPQESSVRRSEIVAKGQFKPPRNIPERIAKMWNDFIQNYHTVQQHIAVSEDGEWLAVSEPTYHQIKQKHPTIAEKAFVPVGEGFYAIDHTKLSAAEQKQLGKAMTSIGGVDLLTANGEAPAAILEGLTYAIQDPTVREQLLYVGNQTHTQRTLRQTVQSLLQTRVHEKQAVCWTLLRNTSAKILGRVT